MLNQARTELAEKGFTILPGIFANETLRTFTDAIEQASSLNTNFRRTANLFAIRNLLQEVQTLPDLLWTVPFNSLLDVLINPDYDCVKGIYFDKPAQSNWVVPYHQDLQISVDRQEQIPNWLNWNQRHGAWSVQPSHDYLDHLYTVRIHLDNCDQTNGALKVIPGSHRLGILSNTDLQDLDKSQATICTVPRGGLLIMRPLLVHASGKSVSNTNRRVIHLELTDRQLPKDVRWRELSSRRNRSERK